MSTTECVCNDDLLWAMQQRNLVYNYNFLNYSNKTVNTIVTYNHPDGWVYKDAGTGGQIGFDPASASCLIKKSTGNAEMRFSQAINEFPRWRQTLPGKKVSACAVVQIPGTADGTVTFSLYDGKDTSSKTVFLSGGTQMEIRVSLEVSKSATTLIAAITSSTSDALLYISRVYANIGSIALEHLPCMVQGTIGERRQYISTEVPPATELSLCEASRELSSEQTRLNSYLNGKFGTGSNGYSLLPDMRGYFSRVWNNGATTDPDAANRTALGKGTVTGDHTGTVEEDQFKEHDHQLQFDLTGQIPAGPAAPMPSINKALVSNTGKRGGAETRGKNIAELYTMKWA
jgi:hypothetical protein